MSWFTLILNSHVLVPCSVFAYDAILVNCYEQKLFSWFGNISLAVEMSCSRNLVIHNSATENSGTLRKYKNMWAKEKDEVNVIKKPRQHLPAQNQKMEILKHSLENV